MANGSLSLGELPAFGKDAVANAVANAVADAVADAVANAIT